MYLIGNGRVITRDSSNPFVENGAVVVENDKIIEVGTTDALKAKYPNAEFVDVENKVIMPGLINTHHHIYSSFARGMALEASTRNFDEILENLWWKVDKALSLEATKYSAYATLIESVKNGVTSVVDHHASPFAIEGSLKTIADVASEIGIRASLCYEVSDRDGIAITDAGIKENVDFIKWADSQNSDMIKGMFGLHAAFTLSNETLAKCQKAMKDLNAGYHVHTAEGYTDLTLSLKEHGKRVVERLNDYEIFRENSIAVHCIHVNEHELNILRDSKCNIVHNPESNMGNAVGCSPVIQMFKKGIKVGLGTDGYTSDMLESLKVANILHKHHLCDPTVAWGEAPAMLFDNNREIIKKQFGCETGVLKSGAKADVIVLDYIPHTHLNGNTFGGHILFGMSGKYTVSTMINGKFVMRDRKLVNLDEEKIFAKAREVSREFWTTLGVK